MVSGAPGKMVGERNGPPEALVAYDPGSRPVSRTDRTGRSAMLHTETVKTGAIRTNSLGENRFQGVPAMGLFGPSRDEVWRKLSQEIGAEYVEGGLWKGNKVQAEVGEWTVTLDTHAVHTGHAHITYTRMRAPFVNPEGFRFTIYRKSAFTGLGKWLGMQDIEVGGLEFDEDFVIQGNDESRVRTLFGCPVVRKLIQAQPRVRLEVKDSEGWFGPKFPPDVDELHFQVQGDIKDLEQLKGLFDLFAAVLDRLYEIGVARKEDPEVTL